MNKLNCAIGNLAITVHCHLPPNFGKIVRIQSAAGRDSLMDEFVDLDSLSQDFYESESIGVPDQVDRYRWKEI
jgi:hypothetical protein